LLQNKWSTEKSPQKMSNRKKRAVDELTEDNGQLNNSIEEESPPKKRSRTNKDNEVQTPSATPSGVNVETSDSKVVWNIDEELTTYEVNGRHVPIPKNRPVRVYADGIYDLFHMGHARSLLQAKSLFPNTCLVVGVCGDEITHKMKGKTVMNEHERVEAVSHCRYVDEVIPHAPWIITPEYMLKHKIDYVSHGEDLSVDENGNDVYQGIKDMGRFLVIKRTEGISTSDLILRIVKDYDKYVRRNLQRGYSFKEMNVGFMKENQIRLDNQLQKFKHKVEDIQGTLRERRDRIILDFKKWRDASEQMLLGFTKRFARGPIANIEGGNYRRSRAESPESPHDEERNKQFADLFVIGEHGGEHEGEQEDDNPIIL
jgi:choline-phosphate cytidylyltransferase